MSTNSDNSGAPRTSDALEARLRELKVHVGEIYDVQVDEGDDGVRDVYLKSDVDALLGESALQTEKEEEELTRGDKWGSPQADLTHRNNGEK